MVFKKTKSDNDAHNGDVQGNYNPAFETHGEEHQEQRTDNNVKVCKLSFIIEVCQK